MVKDVFFSAIMWLLYLAFAATVIFYPSLGSSAVLVDAIGWELSAEILMLLGVAWWASKEAKIDAIQIAKRQPVDHVISAGIRVLLVAAMMMMFCYPIYMGIGWSLLNIFWFLIFYSAVFNVRLNKERNMDAFGYISVTAESRYDRIWLWLLGGNGRRAAIVKTIFDWSVLPFILFTKHAL